jgi:hypothetical protein
VRPIWGSFVILTVMVAVVCSFWAYVLLAAPLEEVCQTDVRYFMKTCWDLENINDKRKIQ